MKLAILLLVFVMLCEIVVGDVLINEIMYNPDGSDNNKEYVEIYSDDIVDLSGYTIEDSASDDDLEMVKQTNNSFSLIVEEGFDYSEINASVYVVGATIGNNLNNGWDLIVLRDDSGDAVDAMSYFSSYGGDGNDKSLCKMPDKDGAWQECDSTPGRGNDEEEGDGCDWELSVVIEEEATDDPEWQIRAVKLEGDGKANLTIRHWIEDSYGDVVKNYSNLNFQNPLTQKTSSKYSPSLSGGAGYFIKAEVVNISCEDNVGENDFVSKLIFVQGEEGEDSMDSRIIIEDVSPMDAVFGDVVKVKMSIYRGDTSKYAVYAYIENDGKRVSEKSTMHAKTKFTNYDLTIPIQLKPNCNGKYDDGNHNVVVEGLGLTESKEITIDGVKSSLCKEGSSTRSSSSCSFSSSTTSSAKKFEYELISKPEEIEVGEEFEAEVELVNNDDEDYDIEIWSYVYRGSKCYSGEREENKQEFVLKADSNEFVKLENKFEEGETGNYNLKVKIRKNNQKTTKDITEEIRVIKEIEETEEAEEEVFEENKPKLAKWSEAMIYESTSFKANKLAPYLFIAALSLLAIILALTKTF